VFAPSFALMSFPASWTVRRARDAYLAENGFTVEAYDAKWTDGSFLGVKLSVPNTRKHRWAIMRHDLHHVATGYGTDLVGEAEISAWELRAAGALGVYVSAIVLGGALLGVFRAPRRTLDAFRAGKRIRFLYRGPDSDEEYEALLNLTVGQLRALMGVPEDGVATHPAMRHDFAPKDVARGSHVSHAP
jgi:hypothetical protein